jgi:Ni2+-binding GTPase involved in maturation of urease and hydrogenase
VSVSGKAVLCPVGTNIKSGLGLSGLQVINKTDLAEAIGADLKVMERDSLRMRDGGPFVFAQVPSSEPCTSHIILGLLLLLVSLL